MALAHLFREVATSTRPLFKAARAFGKLQLCRFLFDSMDSLSLAQTWRGGIACMAWRGFALPDMARLGMAMSWWT